jgi:pilus assembly protein Flp/PilA
VAARPALILAARLARDEAGATAVEYGLIIAFIFLAIIGGLTAFGGANNAEYTRIGNAIAGATH